MPAYARGQIVVEDQVGVYHCIAQCVRRAFLCGVDPYTGQDYSHRKEWILDRLRELAGLFAIEVSGYSVMSNHLHLVLRNRPDIAEQWSDEEIALRWCRRFPSPRRCHGRARRTRRARPGHAHGGPRSTGGTAQASGKPVVVHEVLMREYRPGCQSRGRFSGRFWAGRFKSVALLDEAAILACSVYVDLNPIRAGLATLPEESPYTSGRDRIQSMAEASTRSSSVG